MSLPACVPTRSWVLGAILSKSLLPHALCLTPPLEGFVKMQSPSRVVSRHASQVTSPAMQATLSPRDQAWNVPPIKEAASN
eukprot:11173998-Lingulodinium_polyedra.AAC.1